MLLVQQGDELGGVPEMVFGGDKTDWLDLVKPLEKPLSILGGLFQGKSSKMKRYYSRCHLTFSLGL